MQQHIVKIIYNDILCVTLTKRNIKRICAELSFVNVWSIYQIQKSNTPLTRVIMNLNAIWAMFHGEMQIQRVDIEVTKRKSSFHVT
jgi:hypothetical protein